MSRYGYDITYTCGGSSSCYKGNNFKTKSEAKKKANDVIDTIKNKPSIKIHTYTIYTTHYVNDTKVKDSNIVSRLYDSLNKRKSSDNQEIDKRKSIM